MFQLGDHDRSFTPRFCFQIIGPNARNGVRMIVIAPTVHYFERSWLLCGNQAFEFDEAKHLYILPTEVLLTLFTEASLPGIRAHARETGAIS